MAANLLFSWYHSTSREIPVRHPQLLILLRNHLLGILRGYLYTEGKYIEIK